MSVTYLIFFLTLARIEATPGPARPDLTFSTTFPTTFSLIGRKGLHSLLSDNYD